MSDVFVVAWRRLDKVPDDALPWLLGCARRIIANQRRAVPPAWEGLDVARAAAVIGYSQRAFAMRLHRARRRLAVAMAASSPFDLT